jgi:hypothetical protein
MDQFGHRSELHPFHYMTAMLFDRALASPEFAPSEIRSHRGNNYWGSDSEAFTKPSLQHASTLTILALRRKCKTTPDLDTTLF